MTRPASDLVLSVAAAVPLLVALLLWLPTAAPAATPVDRDCAPGTFVYLVKTFNNVSCQTADDVSFGLSGRFNRPSRFRGNRSLVRITQRDLRRGTWRCRWQSADIHNEIILWACKRNAGVITWVWRYEPI